MTSSGASSSSTFDGTRNFFCISNACEAVRGKPSRSQPLEAQSGLESRSTTRLTISSSGTSSPS
eukprot:4380969-Pleurochrysis_carterae.AAC.1